MYHNELKNIASRSVCYIDILHFLNVKNQIFFMVQHLKTSFGEKLNFQPIDDLLFAILFLETRNNETKVAMLPEP